MSSLSRNIGFSIITFAGQIISGTIVFIVLARLMNLSEFGLLSFGSSLAGLVVVCAEFGYSLMAQRDIPQKRYPFNAYVFNTVLQKGILSALTLMAGAVYLFAFFAGENVVMGLIFLAYGLVTALLMYFLAVFRSKNRFQIESLSSFVYTLLVLGVVCGYWLGAIDVFYVALGLLASRLVQLTVLLFHYKREFGLEGFTYDREIQKYLFRNSFSFGLHYVIGIFYLTIDTQLITYFFGNESVAVYQAFFRVVLILLVGGDLLINVFLPYLASVYLADRSRFMHVSETMNRTIITLGLAFFVGLNLFAPLIIHVLYQAKYDAALALTLPLSFVLLFRVWTTLYASLLTISEHQGARLLIVFISLIVNLALNSFVIPRHGYLGAAFVSMVTHLVLVTLYVYYGRKYIGSVLVRPGLAFFVVGTVVAVLFAIRFDLGAGDWRSALALVVWMIALGLYYGKSGVVETRKMLRGGF